MEVVEGGCGLVLVWYLQSLVVRRMLIGCLFLIMLLQMQSIKFFDSVGTLLGSMMSGPLAGPELFRACCAVDASSCARLCASNRGAVVSVAEVSA